MTPDATPTGTPASAGPARVRLGTDLSLVNEWCTVHLLEPLSERVRTHRAREWGRAQKTATWLPVGPKLFRLASVEDCDVAVLPFAWEDTTDPARMTQARAFAARATAASRPTLVFYYGDEWRPVPLPNAVAFRASGYRSAATAADFATPAWIADPLGRVGGQVQPRRYPVSPSVGFCGSAPPLGRPPGEPAAGRAYQALRRGIRRARWRIGIDDRYGRLPPAHLRADAVRSLQRARLVAPDVILRADRVPIVELPTGPRAGEQRMREEYLVHLLRNDYALAVRGNGNFSARLYEVLAAGRIPVFVDTDCLLPWPGELDWRRLVVWVDHSQVRRLDELVSAAHRAMSPEEFTERQLAGRRVWEQALSMTGYFSRLHDRLRRALATGSLSGAEGRARLLAALR